MGHRIRERRAIPEFDPPTFGYGTISLYELESLYGERLSLHAQIKRLEMELDKGMLSVMLAAGDTTMQVKLKTNMQARARPDYSGNIMGWYYSGKEYTIYGSQDVCYKLSATGKHWIPKSNCIVIGETEPTDPPPADTGKPYKMIILRKDMPPWEFDLTESE